MNQDRRLHYFDMLKGLAIFLVVAGHVLSMCVREIDRTFLLKLVASLHMPLFFFISGYFTFRLTQAGTPFALPGLGARFRQLVVPGTVTALLWQVYFPHSGLQCPFEMTWSGMWLQPYKCGYWFTFVLFEIIAIYWVTAPLLRRLKTTAARVAVAAAVWAVLTGACMVPEIGGSVPARLASLGLVAAFWPVFMAGVFARGQGDRFTAFCRRGDVFTVSLTAAAFLVYLLSYRWEFARLSPLVFTVAEPVLHVAVAIVGIALVAPWARYAYSPEASPFAGRFASVWSYLGTQSLAIYLLHYFFLFPLPALRGALESMSLGFVPSLTVAAAVASLVIAAVLLFNLVIMPSGLLSWLLAGRTAARKTVRQ